MWPKLEYKLQASRHFRFTWALQTDLEDRSRQDNIRIHGVKEGAEENSLSPLLLRYKSNKLTLQRSIIAKLSSYRMKEEVWDWLGRRGCACYFEKAKRVRWSESCVTGEENSNCVLGQAKSFLPEGTVMYGLAEEASEGQSLFSVLGWQTVNYCIYQSSMLAITKNIIVQCQGLPLSHTHKWTKAGLQTRALSHQLGGKTPPQSPLPIGAPLGSQRRSHK